MSDKNLSELLTSTQVAAYSALDQTVDALKTLYRASGLLADGTELEMVITADLDHAECVTGHSAYVYAQGDTDGVRTDCLPPPHLLVQLGLKSNG
ncbi:MAG TPA: hypothetical protein VJ741_05770 [Solirubrobacteraceae bacterium]|nr:hypothetical protein [Solirubrobacteraceae bacterium]